MRLARVGTCAGCAAPQDDQPRSGGGRGGRAGQVGRARLRPCGLDTLTAEACATRERAHVCPPVRSLWRLAARRPTGVLAVWTELDDEEEGVLRSRG
jgi:hypothetical protein